MSTIGFYKSLNNMGERECIEKFLLYNASLVISEAKPSATITLKKGKDSIYDKWIKYGKDFLGNINIKHIDLRECDNALIILIYDEEQLKKYIFREENKAFLMKLGYYEEEKIDSYMEKLKERYNEFKCPHELGVFLGFPIDDVKDFMECTKKKCLACGYWMGFDNYNTAKKIFNTYDRIKEHTMEHILKGSSSHKVVYNLKNVINEFEYVAI